MKKDKIKFIFFVFGLIVIFFTGLSWWLSKTFGEITLSEIVLIIETADTLTSFTEYDKNIIRHFLQWTGLCLTACIIWYFLLYKRSQYIYIYILK